MGRIKYILCIAFLAHALLLAGQSKSTLREMFVSAEGELLFEEYAEALPKYLSLLQIYPENYNLYFRIGQCYLNTPGEKAKAIPYLETAAKNISLKYGNSRFSQRHAPYDVLYHLANAYRIDGNFEKALDTYQLFMAGVDAEKYDTALIRFQMQTCHTAQKMMRRPVSVVEKKLGETINSQFSEFNPVISADEKTLLFTRSLPFYDAIFWSRKRDGQWSEPVNLTPQLGIDQDYYTSSLSPDGKLLLMYKADTYDGNIYMSRLEGDTWGRVEKLNSNINTKYWESHATISSDGKRLFFSSNRRESIGGLDIFVSERDSSGRWGPAVNLGPTINTIYNEDTPFLANNDSTLFFSSRGHENMGGYDIFRSDLDSDGNWSTPVNIGYPVNTPDDDLHFMPVRGGGRGYYARYDMEGSGKMDIYSCDIYSDLNPRKFIVTGKALVSNLSAEFLQPVTVTAVNRSDVKDITATETTPESGYYLMKLPAGAYTVGYHSDDTVTEEYEIELTPGKIGDTLRMQPVILAATDFSAWLQLLTDTIIELSDDSPADIELMAEKRSLLEVEVTSPDSSLTVELFRLTESIFTYSLQPQRGVTRVGLTLTDRFGNDTSAVVWVHRTDKEARIKDLPAADRESIDDKVTADERKDDDRLTGTDSGRPADTREPADPPMPDLTPEIDNGDPDTDNGEVDRSVTAGDTAGEGAEVTSGAGCFRWLLLAALLVTILIIFLRRKKEENKKEQ